MNPNEEAYDLASLMKSSIRQELLKWRNVTEISVIRQGRHWEAYRALLDAKKSGQLPSTDAYNVLLGLCCETGNADVLNEIVGDMNRVGCRFDLESVQLIARGKIGGGDIEEGIGFLESKKEILRPEVGTLKVIEKCLILYSLDCELCYGRLHFGRKGRRGVAAV